MTKIIGRTVIPHPPPATSNYPALRFSFPALPTVAAAFSWNTSDCLPYWSLFFLTEACEGRIEQEYLELFSINLVPMLVQEGY